MYFQLEVNYYSSEATKINKNFQSIASTNGNLKIPEEQIVQGIYTKDKNLQNIFFKCYLCLLEQDISCSIFTSIQYM